MGARCGGCQVDRRTTVGTIDRLHVPSQLRDLLRCERADEVFFLQEVEECREAAVAIRALEVFEAGRALHVMRLAQPPTAMRTLAGVRLRHVRLRRALADDAEERQR